MKITIMDDFKNPKFMFQCMDTELLTKAVNGEINVLQLIKTELANRGLDSNGKWVGFKKSAELHGVK
jgi:hypothetical protein